MANIRKNHSAEIKTKVTHAAITDSMTQSELSSKFGVHSSRVSSWRKQAIEFIRNGFSSSKKNLSLSKDNSALIDELYQQIGQQKVELDWLKKKSGLVS